MAESCKRNLEELQESVKRLRAEGSPEEAKQLLKSAVDQINAMDDA